MLVSVEKPGSPEEVLEHVGVKGMRWGVRKERNSSSKPKTSVELAAQKEHRKQVAKRVAIGVGVLTVVAGTAFVAYKLNQNGKLPISSLKKKPPSVDAIKSVKETIIQSDVIHASRGKTKGYRIFKSGGVPNPLERYSQAFGNSGTGTKDGFFSHLPDGSIAATFKDLSGLKDQAGRPITHDVIIPKSMTTGISGIDDVKSKIWPLIKDSYDPT